MIIAEFTIINYIIFLNIGFIAKFDIWNQPKGLNVPVHVLISPDGFSSFKAEFVKSNLKYSVINNDVQK